MEQKELTSKEIKTMLRHLHKTMFFWAMVLIYPLLFLIFIDNHLGKVIDVVSLITASNIAMLIYIFVVPVFLMFDFIQGCSAIFCNKINEQTGYYKMLNFEISERLFSTRRTLLTIRVNRTLREFKSKKFKKLKL